LISQANEQIKVVFTVKEHYINDQPFSQSQEIRWHHLSFLQPEETKQLVRLVKQKTNLNWSREAMKCVPEFTGGHPFLAQQLCKVVSQRYREGQTTYHLPQ
jgi:predicted NAD-dependent protein-ADP-ribosyltransferase YbiA (DUF1768 family)